MKLDKFFKILLDKYPDQLENMRDGYYYDELKRKIHISKGLIILAKKNTR